MAVVQISSVNLQRNPWKFMSVLSSAVCEWLLMILLFVDAALSYFVTKFACYCGLQIPCLLCSRLDHVFEKKNPGFYWNLFCSNHKMEISSLISCHIHGKLADVREMCEECLVSFIMLNKSNPESYRSMVGKLGLDFELCGFQSPFLNKNLVAGSLSKGHCSCCNKPWRARENVQRPIQLNPVGFGASKANVKPPLPRLPGRTRLSRRDSMKKMRQKFSGPVAPRRYGRNTGVDSLSHVGYTELKIASDSESEVLFSDDDDVRSVVHEKIDPIENIVVHRGPRSVPEAVTDDVIPGKRTHQASNPWPSLVDQSVELDASQPNHAKTFVSDIIGYGLGELNWEQPDPKRNPSSITELILLDDVPLSSNSFDIPSGVSAEGPNPNNPVSHMMSSLSALSDLMPLNHVPPSSNVVELPLGVSPEKDVPNDIELASVTRHTGLSESINENAREDISKDSAPKTAKFMNFTDVSISAVSREGSEVPGVLAEQLTVSDPGEVDRDLKLMQNILSTQEMDSSLNNTSPRACGHSDGLQRSDASSSLERNDSGCESVDGNSVCEINGEGVVDRLRRQVEHDRRCMSALYKELEEERSASAIAANQAMAMITRLQEEKSVLHMEALQYLRMMEEQAEYDMEALEKANDLLAEKDKEMQDLEAELEFYRINCPAESAMGIPHEEMSHSKGEKMAGENNGALCIDNNGNVACDSRSTMTSTGSHKPINGKTSLLDFEDEKHYISQCLKKLERTLHQVSTNGVTNDRPNGGCFEKISNGVDQEEFPPDWGTGTQNQIDHSKESNGVSTGKVFYASNGSPYTKDVSVSSVEDNDFVCEEDNHFDSDQQTSSIHGGKIDMTALENEILDLNDRLEALEANHDFLEHAFSSLQNGSEGLQFIKDIAHQLEELRNFESRRCVIVP